MKSLITRFVREDQGQDIIEYALLAGFISLAGAAVLVLIGPKISTLYTAVSTELTNAGS
jgi:pilus assembly protein Flp/PilA